MKKEKYPARLHVLIAHDSEKAVVIRRGPSKECCILGWDRKANTFSMSQWLKGRIYERRCDVSPSGKHWIYFAMNGKWESETKGAWTAIGKWPWLKAIELHVKGDCWQGGGLFLNDTEFWLNGDHGHTKLYGSSEIKQNKTYNPPNQYGGECLNVYYNRLQRDGWTIISREQNGIGNGKTLFEKELPKKWVIRKRCHEQISPPKGRGVYWDEHELVDSEGISYLMPDWEWAEWVDGAIVYAERGCLLKLTFASSRKMDEPKLLHDFNSYSFETRQAPY